MIVELGVPKGEGQGGLGNGRVDVFCLLVPAPWVFGIGVRFPSFVQIICQ